ncbi:MAG TPA: PfkB family carbohydrate kinase, partial [Dongiaceae bacterium]|nr:PfkB family carbohydrate kinase [Dongiaceae bacterium]
DQERRLDLDAGEVGRLVDRLKALLDRAQGMVISDYGKGVITAELLAAVLPEAHRRGVPVCVDPKERHVRLYQGVSTLTPNTLEAGEVVDTRIRSEEDLFRVAKDILALTAAKSVLITRGRDGMSLFEPDGTHTHLPTVAREVYDVTGAGDTVVSVVALALASGGDLVSACRLANHAAGIVIREIGTATCSPAQLLADLAAEPR